MIREPKVTYVHCFAGRGRSATVVAAYLLQAGIADSVEAAEDFMRSKRPVVRLGKVQRALARRFERQA